MWRRRSTTPCSSDRCHGWCCAGSWWPPSSPFTWLYGPSAERLRAACQVALFRRPPRRAPSRRRAPRLLERLGDADADAAQGGHLLGWNLLADASLGQIAHGACDPADTLPPALD